MNDQNGGPNETSEAKIKPDVSEEDAKPHVHEADATGAEDHRDGAGAPLYGRTRTPTVIEGSATELHHEPNPPAEPPHEVLSETTVDARLETGDSSQAESETTHDAPYKTPEPEINEPVAEAEASPPNEGDAQEAPEADPPEPDAPPPPVAKAEKPRKSPSLIAATVGVVALGAGGYYGWTELVAPSEKSALIDEASKLIGIKPPATQPKEAQPQEAQSQAAPPQETKPQDGQAREAQSQETQPQEAQPQTNQTREAKASDILPPEAAPAPVEPPKSEETAAPASPPVPPPSEPVTKAETPAEPAVKADAPAPEAKAPEASAPTEAKVPEPKAQAKAPEPSVPEPKVSEPTPQPEPAPKAAAEAPVQAPAPTVALAPVEPPAEPVRASSDPAASEKLAQVTAQLADTKAALAQVTQRLQSVEGQLTAPKTETPAEIAAREAGLVHDASTRVILAQSLLTALRQGDDFSPQLAGLQGFDGDSPRILSLREALSSPSAAKLAADFATLAPKLAAASAPQPQAKKPDAKPQDAAAPRNLGATILSFLETRAEKLVKIRPVGAPESNDETGARLKKIEQNLRRGDIAAALEERLHLPDAALVLSADWAKGAQARLDAELAAKAELSEALQALSKSRS